MKSAEPDPDPEPTPKVQPTLLGTWQRVRIEQDDDGNEITQTTLLTFTATHYFDRTVVSESGVRFDDWDNAGTYTTTTATSMEKTFYIDDDDDGIAEESSVEKEFLFTGDSLLIHHWGSEHRDQSYERFERLEGLPTTGATTLQGTWRRARYWDDDEHGPSRQIFALTLTRTRFIESFVYGDSATDGIRDDEHHRGGQGGWSATEADTITKMFIIDDGVEGSVDKKYVLAGDLLAVQCWMCDEPGTHYDVFTRVQDPIPGGMVGSWQFDWVWDHENEDESDDLLFTLTAEVAAESITLVRERRNRSGELDHIRTIEATWEFDPVEWFVNLTIIQATKVEGEEEPEVDDHPDFAPGTRRRIALAPSAMPDHVRVSYLWDEEQWDDVQGQWVARPDNPFGDYWMGWERQ